MAYNDNRDILSWKRLINSIQTNDKLGVVRESIKEGGVHKIQVDQQKHISAEHHEVVVSSNDMGIIVDIYDKQSNNIDTNTYWNDDIPTGELGRYHTEGAKNIKEGTWSVPETPEQVKKLTHLLKNPLDAETALDELYDVFGDDQLFDDLEVMKREEPETDVRHVVISRLKDMNFIKEVREGWGLDLVKGIGKYGKRGLKRLSRLGSKNTKDHYDGEGGFIGTDTTWNEATEIKESLASETDQRLALEELVMSYWDSLPDNMQDELKTFWDAPRDTDEIKPFDETEQVNELEDDGSLEYGDTEEDMAKALGMTQDEFWELAERVGQDQYGSLTKDNYQDVMDHIVDNEASYKQTHVFSKAGEFDEEIA